MPGLRLAVRRGGRGQLRHDGGQAGAGPGHHLLLRHLGLHARHRLLALHQEEELTIIRDIYTVVYKE